MVKQAGMAGGTLRFLWADLAAKIVVSSCWERVGRGMLISEIMVEHE